MIRGYDSSPYIGKMRSSEDSIYMQKEIDRQKLKGNAAEERFQRTKQWLGITD